LVKKIPRTLRQPLSENLIDMLLESDEETSIPPSLAKIILHYMQRDQLDSQAGLSSLLKASYEASPDNTLKIIESYNLEDLVVTLRTA
jgi:hypothetical protein